MPRQAQNMFPQFDLGMDEATALVFSAKRDIKIPMMELPKGLKYNSRLKIDGLKLMGGLGDAAIPVCFFDPQYRGVLDHMGYGNEGKARGRSRCALAQMDTSKITAFVREIDRVLIPSGHLFLWMDKYELLNGCRDWLAGTNLDVVDLVNWDKGRMGMGYRSRRVTEYCLVLQKQPRRAKGVWKIHNIPDTWRESAPKGTHPHRKPVELQGELIAAVTNEGDVVLDPAAGDFTVMKSARLRGRNFLGGDLNG